MTCDLPLDIDASPIAEPRLQDRSDRAAIGAGEPDDELVAVGAALSGDAGTAGPGWGIGNTQPMELAAVTDRRPVAQAASSGELRTLARVAAEVPADPGLALTKEPLAVRFRVGPAAPRRRRHRHHQSVSRMDRDPQAA